MEPILPYRKIANGTAAVNGKQKRVTAATRVTWRRKGSRMKTNYGYELCVTPLENTNSRTQFSPDTD
jgi:hypothetical protein